MGKVRRYVQHMNAQCLVMATCILRMLSSWATTEVSRVPSQGPACHCDLLHCCVKMSLAFQERLSGVVWLLVTPCMIECRNQPAAIHVLECKLYMPSNPTLSVDQLRSDQPHEQPRLRQIAVKRRLTASSSCISKKRLPGLLYARIGRARGVANKVLRRSSHYIYFALTALVHAASSNICISLC